MKIAVSIALFLGLLIIWRLAWRTRPILAFGITIGALVTWVVIAIAGMPAVEAVPLWLPPLPFAVVAVTLFVFGVLAWIWGDADQRAASGDGVGTSPHEHH